MRQFQIVEAPANRPPRGATLIRTANLPNFDDVHEVGGLQYQPDSCGDAFVNATRICGGAFVGWDAPPDRPEWVQYVAPFVAAGQQCSLMGGEEEVAIVDARATRLLDQCETVGIARELWRGDVARAEVVAGDVDFPNDYLTKASTLDALNASALTPLVEAFAWLEAALATCSCGGVGIIHASPYTASLWVGARLIERDATGRLVSGLGTLIVADPGYDGTGPSDPADPPAPAPADHDNAWAYGTTMVDVRRGTTSTVGDRSTIDRQTNDYLRYAVKPFAATFDPCCHVGVRVDHTDRS